jgi:hypothetical protein
VSKHEDGRQTALMATCADHTAHAPEAEQVLVEVHGDVARIELPHVGTTIDFDRAELLAALDVAA